MDQVSLAYSRTGTTSVRKMRVLVVRDSRSQFQMVFRSALKAPDAFPLRTDQGRSQGEGGTGGRPYRNIFLLSPPVPKYFFLCGF